MIKLPQCHMVIEGRDLDGPARTAYERSIQGVLSVIQSKRSGRPLLDWIRNCGTGMWESGDNVDPTQFVDPEYVRLVKEYCGQHPRLSRGLACVNAQLDPFRAHDRLAS